MFGVEIFSHRGAWRDLDESLSLPILVLHGECDQEFEVGQAKQLTVDVPLARTVSIRNAGHLTHIDAPDEWNAAVAEFLHTF